MDLKRKDILVSKTSDAMVSTKTTVDDINTQNFIWGAKQTGNNYKSVTIQNKVYALNDCVCCRSGLEVDYIGKIMKLSEDNDKKNCILRWFFRPFELPTSIKGLNYTPDARELFLASGNGVGVENKNLLVRCYNISNIRNIHNVENVVSLEVIVGKCKVLCIVEDDFNDLPSTEHLNASDFFFSKAFDCDNLEIVGLDGVVDAIGAQKVYNKKEWLSERITKISCSQISSPKITSCQSFSAFTLPTNPSDKKVLPPPSSPSTNKMSTKRITNKRKREAMENIMPLKKKSEKTKKTKSYRVSKNSKLLVASTIEITSTKQEDEDTKSAIESISDVGDVNALQTLNTRLMQWEEPQPSSSKENLNLLENNHMYGDLKIYRNLSNNVHVILEQATKIVGNNADDIHVTCEGLPMQIFIEPLEKLEISTNKLKRGRGRSKLGIVENETITFGNILDSKNNKTTLASEKSIGLKATQNRRGKHSSNNTLETVLKKPVVKKATKASNGRTQPNRSKKIKEIPLKVDKTMNESQRPGIDFMPKNELTCLKSKDELSLQSTMDVLNLPINRECLRDANYVEVEPLKILQPLGEIQDGLLEILAPPPMQVFKSQCEDSNKAIEMAIIARRVLLLNNVDPEFHSADLEEAFNKLLKTKCEVQKVPPICFSYDTTSVLLKLLTTEIAREVLQNLCENCLVVGDRTITITMYESSEYAKEIPRFHGLINIQPKNEQLNNECCGGEVIFPHPAQGNTIEFAFGLRWRMLQEHHEIQWQLLKEMHQKEFHALQKEATKQSRPKRLK